MIDLVLTGCRITPCDDGTIEPTDADAIGIDGGVIAYIGPGFAAPAAHRVVDLGGSLVTPGLVDPHTHLVYGGDRLADFHRRVDGAGYAEIATGGGGILSTVAATQKASVDDLTLMAAKRMRWLARSGVTTVEVKSGYGMDVDVEMRMLEVAAAAGRAAGVRVAPTLLGAHAVPDDRARRDHVAAVCAEMIPEASRRGLATAVDVFADSIAFTAAETDAIFTAADAAGLRVKAHVGQLADIGAAAVAADHGALSVDHCEHLTETDVELLAPAGTVAVLVPGASVYLGETTMPPVAGFRRHAVPMAVTTDLNPGSSPLAALTTAGALAVHRFGLTPTEAVLGMTAVAADAIGATDGCGRVSLGGIADLAVWDAADAADAAELVYWLNAPICRMIVVGGEMTWWEGAAT